MAIADALLTGKPAFVAVTSGPGVTNVITCVADAFYDSIPLIVLTGQVGTADLQRPDTLRQRGFQEVPTSGLMARITKKTFQPHNLEELKDALLQAMAIAIDGRPGPVLLDLPMDVQLTEIPEGMLDEFSNSLQNFSPTQTTCFSDETSLLGQTADLLAHAERPLILVGGGSVAGFNAVRKLIQALNIPVVSSLRGIGVVPTRHPLYRGWIGHTGFPLANRIIHEADLILVLGSRLDVRQTGTEVEHFRSKEIVHVDIDREELSHSRIQTRLRIHSTVQQFADHFLNLAPRISPKIASWTTHLVNTQSDRDALSDFGYEQGVRPDELLKYINTISEESKTAVVTGVGAHQQWASRYFSFDIPEKILLTSAGHGTMGFGLPVSLGIQMLDTERKVICIDGDGSFQMNLQELALASERNIPVKILIMNNARLGIVSQFQNITFGTDPVTGNFSGPNFTLISEAFGVKSWSMNTLNKETVKAWFHHEGPALLNVKIQHDAPVSPMLLAGQPLDKMWRHPQP